MDPAPDPAVAPASDPPLVTLGDRLILALWIAVLLALARALLQSVVDATADAEHGLLLAEHFVEHVVEATGRTWWMVPALAILPRAQRLSFALLRATLVALACGAFLVGWPDGEARYTPGLDSVRGFQGWVAALLAALLLATLDRYVTSPRRAIFRLAPATRFVATAAVLLLGGAALGSLVVLLERRRLNMEVDTIVVDLLDELPRAKLTAAPDGRVPTVGSLLAPRGEGMLGGNQPSLVVPVGAAAEFEVDLPPHATLQFGLAVDHSTIVAENAPAQWLELAVKVDGVEKQATALRPQERVDDRRWIDGSIELTTREAGHARIALALRGTGSGLEGVRAGFGRPRVVQHEWRPRVAATRERMNVVLLVVDSLRPDHLGCYGATRPTSPALDALARDGILFEQARASSTWSWPAIATLLTGLYPPTHGVFDLDRCFLSDSLTTLPELLAGAGITTLGASSNPLITRAKNFDQGFVDFREFQQLPAERVVEQFGDWMRRYGAWQFFAFLHVNDPHRPFNPPDPFATRFAPAADATAMRTAVNDLRLRLARRADPSRAVGPVASEEDVLPKLSAESLEGLYDGEIRYVDEQIARVLTLLKREGLLDKTVVVVVGSFGETLAPGPAPTAGSSLATELRHVPLVIRDPRQPARRVAELVDTTFLASTLAKLAGVEPAGAGNSIALPPWGAAAPRFAFFHTARGVLPGESRAVELIGMEGGGARLVMGVDGRVVEFVEEPPKPGDREQRLKALTGRLTRWHELTLQDAVARPFERLDFATRYALDLLAEPEGSR